MIIADDRGLVEAPKARSGMTANSSRSQRSMEQGSVLTPSHRESEDAVGLRRHRRARSPHAAGFTLLEMLIVLVIIGLLAGLVGPRLLERLDTSRVTTAEVQVRNLRTALDTFRLDVGRYPTTDEGLDVLTNPPSDPEMRTRWKGPYLEDALPKDPWGHPYNYAYSGSGNPPFALYSYGAEGKPSADGTTKGIGILPQS